MKKYNLLLFIPVLLCFFTGRIEAQFTMKFGDILPEQLSNKPCKFDPGAGAEILSDIGKATINYLDRFYIEFERDIRIRIINSKGFDYGNVRISYLPGNSLVNYRASAFNLRNGEIVETKIPKKSFLNEKNLNTRSYLRFSFPDVHDGTIVEYSYIERLEKEALMTLVPWDFQRELPIVKTSLTIVYPDFFSYKTIISGNGSIVGSQFAQGNQYIAGEQRTIHNGTWYSQNVPAFISEPYTKSIRENQTRISFELGGVDFPNYSYDEITPTYKSLAKKLNDRDDFGHELISGSFLRSVTGTITKGIDNDLAKVKAIRKFVCDKVFWNGEEDFTATSTLRRAWSDDKGSCADVNMILIIMLRDAGLKADPVILSTRSNGAINQYFAMMQQFNYLIASVTIKGKNYFVDATDPLSPYDLLPFECLNGQGRLISGEDSWFVDVKNSEKYAVSEKIDLKVNSNGSASGLMRMRNTSYSAHDIREAVKLIGEEGYNDILSLEFPEIDLSNIKIENLTAPDSDIVVKASIKNDEACQSNGSVISFNPYFFTQEENPFVSPERKFPVDFGCPREKTFEETITLPDKYSVVSTPENDSFTLGKDDAQYSVSFEKNGNKIILKGSFRISRITYTPSEYSTIRDFYAKVTRSQSRLLFLKKNS